MTFSEIPPWLRFSLVIPSSIIPIFSIDIRHRQLYRREPTTTTTRATASPATRSRHTQSTDCPRDCRHRKFALDRSRHCHSSPLHVFYFDSPDDTNAPRLAITMALQQSMKRFTRSINSKYIYGRVPLLHTIVFLIEMALAARLTARFNSYYDERPLMTMMVTNAILGGIADTVAQTITAFRQRSLLRPNEKDDGMSIPLSDLDRKGAVYDRGLVPNSKALPPTFDFERLTRFMAYGFCMAPVQFKWFRFLERIFPISKTSAFGPAMKRVAFDQLIFAPFGVGVFFTVMTIAEGGGRRAVTHKLKDMYIPTLKANYVVWPAVQIVNFRLMPVQYQLPFVSTIGIAWTAYLSLTNASDE
ncbi:hypothetical protein BKA56DRAFT_595739 [Ilyonectria sp. MPI-CAGE-AT-0026]|nr:hypothetical protein BKA56DRAFT_595739 [Ilyonectria sp. MPI-CAGE-AT-0026]